MTSRRKKTGEFERIANIFAPLAAGYPGAFGLADDAAVVRPRAGYDLVVTTDTLIAGVHFLSDDAPGSIAEKLLRVNLSDLAAMGARPFGYTLNIALPAEVEDAWLDAFAAGLAGDQAEFAVTLIGGDSVATSGPITLTLTALGDVIRGDAMQRSGAQVGDIVYVSGTVGDGAAGLAVAKGRAAALSALDRQYLRRRYAKPEPRLALGRKLCGIAHAVVDISDGLVADLGHIANASRVAIEVDAAILPLSSAAKAALDGNIVSMDDVLGGGDDYELAVTVPEISRNLMATFAKLLGLPLTEIGRVHDGAGVCVVDSNGTDITPANKGYSHA